MALPPLPPKEFLDSDRLNYLVWRYLLESNYRETAAKLQKEWHIATPHRHFSFASCVPNQALVHVVQCGLTHQAYQRQFRQLKGDAATQGQKGEGAPPFGIFGPIDENTARREDEDAEGEPDEGEADIDYEPSRKRPVDRQGSLLIPGSPAAKRQRLSISHDEGADVVSTGPSPRPSPAPPVAATTATATTTTTTATATATAPVATATATATTTTTTEPNVAPPTTETAPAPPPATTPAPAEAEPEASGMDVDEPETTNGHVNGITPYEPEQQQPQTTAQHVHSHTDLNHAYPSPLENDQPPTSPIHTHDKATQLGKVEELSTATTFLQLAGNGPMTAPSSPLRSGGERVPVLLHCEWSPADPSVLAAAGTDSFARVWTISRPVAPSGSGRDEQQQPPPQFADIMPVSAQETAYVTALAWNGDGASIAVATANGDEATISIYSSLGEFMHQLTLDEPPILKLRWNPNNVGLLAISPSDEGASVTIFSPQGRLQHMLPNYNLQERSELDAVWTSESDFLLCGGEMLMALRCTATGVELLRKFEVESGDRFSEILYDAESRLAATPTLGGGLVLWDDVGQRRNISAHAGLITSAQWQPLTSPPTPDERLIATAGDDNTIAIWNARRPDFPATAKLNMKSAVLALAFTPDGAFLAGATASEVMIWKVGDYFMPRATWTRAPHPGWLSPRTNGDAEDVEDQYCLCWDMLGQKLAYGANSRLAVIRFR